MGILLTTKNNLDKLSGTFIYVYLHLLGKSSSFFYYEKNYTGNPLKN